MESAGPVRAVVGPYQHDRRIQRFHTSDFFRLVSLCSRHFLLYISHYHPLLSFRLARNTLISIFSYVSIRTYVRSLGCQCWAWECAMALSLFVFLALPVLSPLSHSRTPYSPPLLPFPFLSPLTSTTPLPLHCLCLPRSPRLSHSRVLLTRTRFSSPLSSIRAGLPAPTHPPPHVGKGCQGGRERGGWVVEAAGRAGGQVRRTGPAIYIFISSSWRAIGDRKKWKEREGEKKIKEQRAL